MWTTTGGVKGHFTGQLYIKFPTSLPFCSAMTQNGIR